MLRLEFEQNLAANEQTGPINREMRHLITSLQNHNSQLKGENARLKKKLKDSNYEIAKLKHTIDHPKEDKTKDKDSTNALNPEKHLETKPSISSDINNVIVKEEQIVKEEIQELFEVKKEKVSYFR
jgi:E3 ubiquitin-protein ligase BRE1